MQFEGKSFYNLLRLKAYQDQKQLDQEWQIEDYRKIPLQELFSRLGSLKVYLTEQSFLLYAEHCDGPEDLTECLVDDESNSERIEKIYLLLFELWRRLCSERQTLSIFCDELDEQIVCYNTNDTPNDDELLSLLADLENILDEYVDEGGNPKDAFSSVVSFCAHDLESFLYDYCSDLLDRGLRTPASELIDGLYEYVEHPFWFEFLRVRLVGDVDEAEMILMLGRLLDQLEDAFDLDLLFEMASYVSSRSKELFIRMVHLAASHLETEGDFDLLVEIVKNHLSFLGQIVVQKQIEDLMKSISPDLEKPFITNDQRIKQLLALLEKSDGSVV